MKSENLKKLRTIILYIALATVGIKGYNTYDNIKYEAKILRDKVRDLVEENQDLERENKILNKIFEEIKKDSFDLSTLKVGIINIDDQESLHIFNEIEYMCFEVYGDKLEIDIINKKNLSFFNEYYEFNEEDELYKTHNVKSVRLLPFMPFLTEEELELICSNDDCRVPKNILDTIHERLLNEYSENKLDNIINFEFEIEKLEDEIYERNENIKKQTLNMLEEKYGNGSH